MPYPSLPYHEEITCSPWVSRRAAALCGRASPRDPIYRTWFTTWFTTLERSLGSLGSMIRLVTSVQGTHVLYTATAYYCHLLYHYCIFYCHEYYRVVWVVCIDNITLIFVVCFIDTSIIHKDFPSVLAQDGRSAPRVKSPQKWGVSRWGRWKSPWWVWKHGEKDGNGMGMGCWWILGKYNGIITRVLDKTIDYLWCQLTSSVAWDLQRWHAWKTWPWAYFPLCHNAMDQSS